MGLRRKLTVTFGALAFVALLIAGVSLWAGARYTSADEELPRHYERSVIVQRVRAATYRAGEELSDALFQRERDFREDFEQRIAPARRDLAVWARLADTGDERREVTEVRGAFRVVVVQSIRVFDAVEEGRVDSARRLYEGRVDRRDLERFERLTDAAVAQDQRRRQVVRASVDETRRTVQLVLLLAVFSAVALVLLIAAYLSADVFRPLGRLGAAFDRVARGDRDVRLDDGRSDEIGALHRGFDEMVEAVSHREALASIGGGGEHANGGANGAGAAGLPSRVALHRLVTSLRSQVASLDGDGGSPDRILRDLDALVGSIGRMTELGFPLDLQLARVDLAVLLHEVADRFREDLARRGVRLELAPSPDLRPVLADRLKLRAVLAELVGNALQALPERGGAIGLRAGLSDDGAHAVIDVADDAGGIDGPVDALLSGGDRAGGDGDTAVGLPSSRALVEAHGGRLLVDSRPGEGTLVRIELPLGDG